MCNLVANSYRELLAKIHAVTLNEGRSDEVRAKREPSKLVTSSSSSRSVLLTFLDGKATGRNSQKATCKNSSIQFDFERKKEVALLMYRSGLLTFLVGTASGRNLQKATFKNICTQPAAPTRCTNKQPKRAGEVF